MPFIKENITRLYVQNEGDICLEICPDPNAPDNGIMIHTPDETSIKWFGKIEFVLLPSEAKKLGQELIKYANNYDENCE